MALSTTPVDINRGTSGVFLPTQLSREIWQDAVKESAVMRLARRINLPGSGLSIPVITGDPTADWVAESTEKPVGEASLSTKTMTPYKLAVIELFSEEFRRDLPALYAALRERLPYAIAKKFDATVFHGVAPGTGFDVLASSPTSSLASDVWGGLVQAKTDVALMNGRLNGWAFAPAGEAVLLGAVDGNNRPLFLDSVRDGGVTRILGANAEIVDAVYDEGVSENVIGIGGDWTKAFFGTVEGIKIKTTDEATINDGTNQINLWQRNMFAVMAEIEVGFVCKDDDYFVRLTMPADASE